jgi:hypothetical protein
MQPTYYERLLADQDLKLASILDDDIARLSESGPLLPVLGDTSLNACRDRYVKSAVAHFQESLAATLGAQQFERFEQTPSYHEALVQKATQQCWIYETCLYLRAHGERTLRIGPEAAAELLFAPLEDYGYRLQLDVPAAMLVFESPELVETFYAGERRSGAGRHHPDAPLCVLALEMRLNGGHEPRRLRVLSAHGDGERDYRVEARQFPLADRLTLEDILEADDGLAAREGENVEQLLGLSSRKLAWASRKADCGYLAAKTPYYRAVLGALYCAATMPERLAWHPKAAPAKGSVSRLGYSELLPGGR